MSLDISPRPESPAPVPDDGKDVEAWGPPPADVATVEPEPRVTATVITPRARQAGDLRPIVPPWMLSRAGWVGTTRWFVRVQWHRVRFHLFRLPLYVLRVAGHAPIGLWRIASGLTRWVLDVRTDNLEQQLATGTKQDAKEFVVLRRDRGIRVRARLAAVAGLGVVLLAAGTWAWVALDPRAHVPALAVLVLLLALVGSDSRHPLIGQAMLASTGWKEINDVIVMRALRAANLAGQAPKIDKDGKESGEDTRATLAGPIARTANGQGTEIVVDLPWGKTAADAAMAVDRLASGFDVSATQVFVEPVQGSTRRALLYVADEDPMTLRPHRSPFARMPKASVWEPNRLAATPHGRPVDVQLLFNSFLVGAIPRAGKSFTAKNLIVPAVLDPWCDLTVMDCGGGRDWLPTEQLAVDYVAGDEEEDLARIVTILEAIQGEARARLAEFRRLSEAEMPEDKLTRELAAQGLRPHVLVIDELQNLIRSQSKEIRVAALQLLVWFAKTAPKAGYIACLITQRPAAEVIPADLRDVISVRIALRTKTPQGSDAILGAYVSSTGYSTHRFLAEHKGAAIIGGIPTGRGGDLQVVKNDLLMPKEFAQACVVGRQRRLDAGTLRGHAAGEDREITITVTVLDDVRTVWPGETPKVQAHVILTRLREVFGDRYAGMDETALTRALKAHKVPAVQVFRDGSNRNGYALTALNKATKAIEAGDS